MRIVLGSGKIYMTEFSGSLPADNVIETDGNRFGAVKGGASIEYKPTFYTAKDDLGTVTKSRLTEEEATLKCGVMTLDVAEGDRLAIPFVGAQNRNAQ